MMANYLKDRLKKLENTPAEEPTETETEGAATEAEAPTFSHPLVITANCKAKCLDLSLVGGKKESESSRAAWQSPCGRYRVAFHALGHKDADVYWALYHGVDGYGNSLWLHCGKGNKVLPHLTLKAATAALEGQVNADRYLAAGLAEMYRTGKTTLAARAVKKALASEDSLPKKKPKPKAQPAKKGAGRAKAKLKIAAGTSKKKVGKKKPAKTKAVGKRSTKKAPRKRAA